MRNRLFCYVLKCGEIYLYSVAYNNILSKYVVIFCAYFCLMVALIACLVIENVANYVKRIRQTKCPQATEK
ncbi:hypothetical protein BC673_10521 [Prevotella pallens]|uniref:Uncharacterized protein n=1 Tax=Prevotella pallens TaxID=60133 RepID=A0ABX9DVG0_9BACT|nr:hypothetical protein BC673_10521 [Prevotella pallens]